MWGFVLLLMLVWLVFLPARRVARSGGPSAIEESVRRRRSARSRDGERRSRPAQEEPPVGLPSGTRLDDYVRSGLQDLQIMLIQHARRRG